MHETEMMSEREKKNTREDKQFNMYSAKMLYF